MKKFSDGKYKCGFTILAFPCNQFHYQEPGANAREIMNGLRYVRPGGGFEPNFPLFQKIQVNGAQEDPIYTFVKSRCPLPGGIVSQAATQILWAPIKSNDISWNFEKILVNHKGNPVKRYLPNTEPFDLIDDIISLLQQC